MTLEVITMKHLQGDGQKHFKQIIYQLRYILIFVCLFFRNKDLDIT